MGRAERCGKHAISEKRQDLGKEREEAKEVCRFMESVDFLVNDIEKFFDHDSESVPEKSIK